MRKRNQKAVFIDTSYLKIAWGDSNWQRLLKLAQEKEAEIYISRIVLEEWRTKTRDAYIEEATAVMDNVREFDERWKNSSIAEGLKICGFYLSENAYQDVEKASKKAIEDFVNQYGIQIYEIKEDHAVRVYSGYFSWGGVFATSQSKIDERAREERRQHIPDGFIAEAALDIKQKGYNVVCLVKDKNLVNHLKAQGMEVFDNAKQILDVLQPENFSNSYQENRNLDESLKEMDENERELQIKILAFVKYLNPISKTNLITLLQRDSYSQESIENSAQRLMLNNFIRDIGIHYLPNQDQLCEEAAHRVMPTILELLGDN